MRFGGITKFLLALIVAAIPFSAAAQNGSIIQSGTVTAGHAGVFATQNVMQDAGTSVNGGFSSLGVTNSGSCGLGVNSSAVTGPYYQTCIGGSGTFSFAAFGGASAVPFNFIINGTTYQIGGSNWLSGWFDSQFCATQGSILYRSSTIWNCLLPGNSGQVLQTNGGGQNPSWASVPGTGTVTSITAGTGLTGGTITTSGTIGTAGVLNDLALISQAQGDIYYYNGSHLVALPPRTSGDVLTTQGASANPIWVTLGTAAFDQTGTSGATVPLLNGVNTWSGAQTISGAAFGLSGNFSASDWGTAGVRYKNAAATITDTTSSGTVATAYTDLFGGNTIAASSATTFTNYFDEYVKAAVSGSNVTITNLWALGADSAKISDLSEFATGGATLGSPTGGNEGAGTLNAANGVYKNGIAYNLASGNGATLDALPVNPTGTTSTTGVMTGLGGTCKITPRYSTRVLVFFTLFGMNNTASDGWETQVFYGTGTAPINGAPSAGTPITGAVGSIGDPANVQHSISHIGLAVGLTQGTSYWFDLMQNAVTGGTATLSNLTCIAIEQ
ncbi:MAG: hypothetical protein KGL35_29025 [Bradyrhizobium sp.]|nr:hypothetical protein [Bradyrhizobium sp.]